MSKPRSLKGRRNRSHSRQPASLGRICSGYDEFRTGIALDDASLRWAAAEGVSETVIAAVLLLHERRVDEIALCGFSNRAFTALLRPKGAEQVMTHSSPPVAATQVEQMSKPRSLKKDAEIAVIPGNPLVLRGPSSLSAAFIADLKEDWEKYGTQILELMREKFPDLYFASIVKLAQIVRIEADVSLKEPKPKTIEEVLQRVEHETGVEGRRAFEGFLKKMHKTKEEQGG